MADQPPDRVFDPGLQHERTSLAWERTAIATMVTGTILARYAAGNARPAITLLGLVQVALGGGILVWAGLHYDGLHGRLRAGESPTHPGAAKGIGLLTVLSSGSALTLATVLTIL
ncbi:MAG: DUF202 domain-containing protein [Actinomycetia bacterium]|nr:DUF202 domain-containing protein [Actinomycetes bacterium]